MLRRRRASAGNAARYRMQEQLVAIGHDSWIEDEAGNRVFKANGKAARLRDTFVLEDADGRGVARIKERVLSVRDAMTIDVGGRNATVKKALVGIRARFHVEVDGAADIKVHGNVVDHEYEMEQDGTTVATVSRKWFRVRDTYGVEVAAGANVPLVLCITVALDDMTRD